eukprot:TRINITY_DN1897_c0_g1_i1.p3 TRINITY_DN1897_c0_g1~~TRINITY_DN1897_c0_g1_i1.p3  ORF type:complete len:483 (+),score=58.05 TRINITY_DN1897_c0_g1_i1:140-1450(+)
MKETSEPLSSVSGIGVVGSVKFCETEEEIEKYLKHTKISKSPLETSSFCENDEKDVIIALSDSIQWTKVPPQPSLKVAKKTLTERIAEWGTNFMYNAKVGNNLWSALLGDQKLDLSKEVRLLTETYDLPSKEGYKFFIDAFKSLIWMTYRTNFLPLLDTISASVYCEVEEEKLDTATKKLYSTDNGWGCTIRVGQMALANALIRHLYNHEFSHLLLEKQEIKGTLYEKVILDFWDSGKGSKHPFSMQNFCETALKYSRIPGEWLSQSIVANIFRDLNLKHKPYDIDIAVFIDGSIYKDRIGITDTVEETASTKEFEVIDKKEYDEFLKKEEGKADSATIVFVSCALGLKSPNPIYLNRLKDLFEFPQLVGIMGGRTNEALFFVGYQEDNFIFLDPHFVQVITHHIYTIDNDLEGKFGEGVYDISLRYTEATQLFKD